MYWWSLCYHWDEVGKAIDRLKTGKATDLVDVSSEHIKPILTDVFNNMLRRTYIPHSLLTDYIKPTWKRKRTTDDPAKYRGITISSTIGNVFEDIIAQRVENTFSRQQSKLQFGFTTDTTMLCASLLLHKATARQARMEQFTTWCREGFDVVWHSRPLCKLALLGIPADIWLILTLWYRNITAVVQWQGTQSGETRIHQGVRQGWKPHYSSTKFSSMVSLRVLQLLTTRLELVRILTQVGKPSSVYLVLDFMEFWS